MSAFFDGINFGILQNVFGTPFGCYQSFSCFNLISTFSVPRLNCGSVYRYPTPVSYNISLFDSSIQQTEALDDFWAGFESFKSSTSRLQNQQNSMQTYIPTINSTPEWLNFTQTPATEPKKEADTDKKASEPVSKKQKAENKSVVRADLKNKKWNEMTDDELHEVYGHYDRDITKPYKGTAEDLNNYLEGKGVLAGKGQAFIDAQEKHGISASVLVGICMNESDRGRDEKGHTKKNVGGVRILGSTEFRTFESVEACIMEIARFLKVGYVNNSGRPLTKLYQVNAKYCPTSDPTDDSGINGLWAKNVNMYANEVERVTA